MEYNSKLFNEAKKYLVGGVNSPVRAFKGVGGYPIFIKRGAGSRIYGEDGREFIDYCQGFGPLILGHAHPKVIGEIRQAIAKGLCFGACTKKETELAKLISRAMPSIERIRLTNSGTEAVMGAIRVARAWTQKNKIIKFSGSYHGHADYLIDSKGVPGDFTKYTLVSPYNEIKKFEELVERHKRDIAAVIVEPVAANKGVVLPQDDFLPALRSITHRYNILLVFDEVITGFRLSLGGAQKLFELKPDLTCLGKIIGGGLPIGAFGGRREIMRLLAPEGRVYQAGTFSGNPLSVTAGITTLRILFEENPYRKLKILTQELCQGIKERARAFRLNVKVNFIGSIFGIDIALFKGLYYGLLRQGIYLSPSRFEANFLSVAHTHQDLEKTLKAVEQAFSKIRHTIKAYL